MKKLSSIPFFIKVLVIALLLVQLLTIVLSICIHSDLYTSPFPYFMSVIVLFVISMIVGDNFNEVN